MRISDWSSDVCSSDLCREQDDAEGDDQRRVEPGGVDAGGRGLEHHEGRSGVDAPAHDAAVLDFGSKAFPRAGVAPDDGFDLDPVARAGAEPVERRKADLAILGPPEPTLASSEERRVGKEGCRTCVY